MKATRILDRWELLLPDHRADRPQWPWWERVRLEAMYAAIRPGDVVYDIGAEEGDLSGLFATWGARMVLFEPNPRVWPNIKAIWEANGLAPCRKWVGFAAADSTQDALETAAEMYPTFWPECAEGPLISDHGFLNLWERDDVARTRIDTVAAVSERPDVITIDVEGAELSVLRGAERTLREDRPIVFCSVHPEFMVENYGVSPDELLAFMADCGYEHTYLGTDHEQHHMWKPRP